MHTVGIREFKSNTSAWLRKVRQGEEMTITHRGEPVVRLSPIVASSERAKMDWLRESVRRGEASWSGRKPRVRPQGVHLQGNGEGVSDWVIRNRR